MAKLAKRLLSIFLFFFVMTSCSTATCMWNVQLIDTGNTRFNSGRIFLEVSSDSQPFLLEITRSSTGLRFYIHLLFCQVNTESAEPFALQLYNEESQETKTLLPYVLQGGQKLLLSTEDANGLIELLSQNTNCTLTLSKNKIVLTSQAFMEAYAQLLALPVETTNENMCSHF